MKRLLSLLLALTAFLPVLPASANTIELTAEPPSGGTVSGDGVFESGGNATLTAIPNDGYRFDGWYEHGALISPDRILPIIVFSDRTLEARFISETPEPSPSPVAPPSPNPPPPSAVTYTVTYHANGGSGAPSPQTKTQGVGLTLSGSRPSPSGNLVFLGWASGSTAYIPEYQPGGLYTTDADVTLYAVWEPRTSVPAWPVPLIVTFGASALGFGGMLLRKRKK